MAPKEYLNFDLDIERSGDGYRVCVANSPAGQSSAVWTPPFSPLEIENFVLRMGQQRQGMRRMESGQMVAARSFGERLFSATFRDEVLGCYRSSLTEAEQQGKGLRLRLNLSDAPEWIDLPWEYLYHAPLNRFLSLSIDTPLVRYMDFPGRVEPLVVPPPLRVLVLIASPHDHPPLDVEQEWTRLQQAVQGLIERGMLVLERVEPPTLSSLQQRLRRSAYHIFHFVGHGGYDEQVQDGLLILEDENGLGAPVSGQHLGMLLQDEKLRLALINACEGARTSEHDPFSGVGQSLLQQGIPAVIGMQFAISDEAAIVLAREFYSALSDGYPVDAALTEARKAIFARTRDADWGTPVLYLRAPDGRIFDVLPTRSHPVEPPPPPEDVGRDVLLPGAERLVEDAGIRETAKPPRQSDSDTGPSRAPGFPAALVIGVLLFVIVAGVALSYLRGLREERQRAVVQVEPTADSVQPLAPATVGLTPVATVTTATGEAPVVALPTATATEAALAPVGDVTLPPPPAGRAAINRFFLAPDASLYADALPLSADGSDEDWRLLQTRSGVPRAAAEQVFSNSGSRGCAARFPGVERSDLEVEIAFAFDKEFLYIAYWVADDGYIPNASDPSFFWQGDAPQLQLDMDLSGDFDTVTPNADDYGFDFMPGAPEAGTRPRVALFHPLFENRTAREVSPREVRLGASPTRDGYFLEVALPWSRLGGFEPEPGRTLGVVASVSDNDTPSTLARPAQECMVSLTPGSRFWGEPTSSWSTLILAGAP